MLTDKDQRYLQTLEAKGGRCESRNMRGSRLSENAENRGLLSYKLGDSLSRGIEDF